MGTLTIDGTDAYSAWGIFVAGGGHCGLACMPGLKAYAFNDWQEEDGIEADLSAPVLGSKEFTMDFCCSQGQSGYDGLMGALGDGVYHTFSCIGRTCVLRLVGCNGYDAMGSLLTFSLRLADDFPLSGYTYLAPSAVSVVVGNDDYEVDGKSLTDYGAYVVRGGFAETLRWPDVKPAMLRGVSVGPGAIYDGDAVVRYKQRDVKLPCVMRADSLSQLWRNWDALLYDLTRPGARELSTVGGALFACCYKCCSVSVLDPSGKPWLGFTLTLTNLSGRVSVETDVEM